MQLSLQASMRTLPAIESVLGSVPAVNSIGASYFAIVLFDLEADPHVVATRVDGAGNERNSPKNLNWDDGVTSILVFVGPPGGWVSE